MFSRKQSEKILTLEDVLTSLVISFCFAEKTKKVKIVCVVHVCIPKAKHSLGTKTNRDF